MIGELLKPVTNQTVSVFVQSPWVIEYQTESIVLACCKLIRNSGTRSATIYFETLNSENEVVESKLFAARAASEWSGEMFQIYDRYTQEHIFGTSVFANVCEAVQVSVGDIQGFNQIVDDYPVVVVRSTGFYHYRGIEAKCRIQSIPPSPASYTQGVHTIRSPKVAIFRNPTTHTKRYFVRHRARYFANDPANPFLLAPSGDNVVTSAEAVGHFTEGTVYTGDEHPEIELTGSRRTPARVRTERTEIEPFYYLTNLRGGKRIRVTYREIDEGTADPILSSEYPADGTPRADQQLISTGVFPFFRSFTGSCSFVPLM